MRGGDDVGGSGDRGAGTDHATPNSNEDVGDRGDQQVRRPVLRLDRVPDDLMVLGTGGGRMKRRRTLGLGGVGARREGEQHAGEEP